MSGLRIWVPIATRVYLLLALTIGTIFSPMVLSAIPAVFLLWYLYQWRWPINPVIRMLTDYYAFFAVVLLLEPLAGLFSVLAGLPVLFLISRSLEECTGSLTQCKS